MALKNQGIDPLSIVAEHYITNTYIHMALIHAYTHMHMAFEHEYDVQFMAYYKCAITYDVKVMTTDYTGCWLCPLFDILPNKYFSAG
jgi:hypothetical protein